MESWRHCWREGIMPQISLAGLRALETALEIDDPRILQGATCSPPPLQCVRDWPVESACVIGFCGWIGDDIETVAEIEEYFARTCFDADQLLGAPAECRHFLNWVDETHREEMRSGLLAEVKLNLISRTTNVEVTS